MSQSVKRHKWYWGDSTRCPFESNAYLFDINCNCEFTVFLTNWSHCVCWHITVALCKILVGVWVEMFCT